MILLREIPLSHLAALPSEVTAGINDFCRSFYIGDDPVNAIGFAVE